MDDDGGAPENHRNGPAGGSLPRRSAQGHLEPQLRETRGAGFGTPFTAFAAAAEPEDADDPAATSGSAEFVDGARRGRHTEDAGVRRRRAAADQDRHR